MPRARTGLLQSCTRQGSGVFGRLRYITSEPFPLHLNNRNRRSPSRIAKKQIPCFPVTASDNQNFRAMKVSRFEQCYRAVEFVQQRHGTSRSAPCTSAPAPPSPIDHDAHFAICCAFTACFPSFCARYSSDRRRFAPSFPRACSKRDGVPRGANLDTLLRFSAFLIAAFTFIVSGDPK